MTRLLILWLLAERPMHGYQIKKSLTAGGMDFWFDLEDTSIYSSLRTLVRQGHAVEAGIEAADTKRPRTLYAITPKGRRHYEDLLARALRTVPSFTSPIDVVLAAEGDLSTEEMASGLNARLDAASARLASLDQAARSAPDARLVSRHRAHLEAEQAWTRSLL